MADLPILAPARLLKRTTSRCPTCLAAIPADVLEREGRVVIVKSCPDHGASEVTLASDRRFYHVSHGPRTDDGGCGCAGTCADGGRDPFEVLSTCVALIEIVDDCNLACPPCYASSPRAGDAVAG
ncbi:MAG: radical SAM protein, partial [Planctomycetota bacterium]